MADLIVQTNLVGYVLNAETDHDLGAVQEFGNFDAMFGGFWSRYWASLRSADRRNPTRRREARLAGCGKTDNATRIFSRLRDCMTQRRVLSASAASPRFVFPGPRTQCALGLRCSNCQIPHTDQVVSGCSKGEDPSHLEDPAMPNLPQQRDRL